MSASCLRTTLNIAKTFTRSDAFLHTVPFHPAAPRPVIALSQLVIVRHGSFFNRKDGEEQWDSVRSVSNQGRKRGRASRGKMMQKVDLNVGQKLGTGITGHVFPGLSSPFKNRVSMTDLDVQKQLSGPTERSTEPRKPPSRVSSLKLDPLDRGYKGTRMPGRKMAPPDPVDGYEFKDFETYCITSKMVSNMVASQGKTYSAYIVVAVGNKKGLIGLAIGKGSTAKAALKSATGKAVKRLVYINTYENRTIWHSFSETFHKTTVIAHPMYSGYGRKCHPVLKILCELLGIRDIKVVTEGSSKNYLNVARAFLTGLEKQRNHQELADELGHHIVEYSLQRDKYPLVVASPDDSFPRSDFKKEDGFDFENFCLGNRVEYKKPPTKPFYMKFKSFKKKQWREYTRRNQPGAAIDRMVLGMQPELKRIK